MIAPIVAYFVERGRPGIVLPAAAAIAIAAQIDRPIDAVRIATDVLFALLLIAQFRLWDDLADIESDRTMHPDRLLSRTRDLDRFVVFCLALATANIALSAWSGGAAGAVMLILLDAAVSTWYAVRPRHRTAFGDLFLLVKYPAFVLILAGSSASFTAHIPGAIGIYVAACAFEIWHDASSPLRVWGSDLVFQHRPDVEIQDPTPKATHGRPDARTRVKA